MFPADPAGGGLFELAFARAPVAMCVSRGLRIAACNPLFAEMFNCAASQLVGRPLQGLCRNRQEFRKCGVRFVRALGREGRSCGELVLTSGENEIRCRVTGSTAPGSGLVVWVVQPTGAQHPAALDLSPREREVAALLIKGQSAKQMARSLGLSPRTVEMHRGNLMKKYQAASTPVLVARLHAEEVGQVARSPAPIRWSAGWTA